MRQVRGATEEDYPFIYATWLRSQYYGNSWFKQIDKDTFFNSYKLVVETRLRSSSVRVSCLSSDPEIVLGYSVTSPDDTTLHWVYVKRAWRGLGVAKELVPSTIATATSLTKIGKALLPSEVKFNPFI